VGAAALLVIARTAVHDEGGVVRPCGSGGTAAAIPVRLREAAPMTNGRIRRITVIAPMYNEADHVEDLVADIAAQDWEGELELLVADGRSTDGSAERLQGAAARHGLSLTVIDKPERWVSPALNRCILAATGDLIVRVDCHSRYPADYLRRCAIAAEETGAENVGGLTVPTGRTPTERAVAAAVDSPFGGIGWTRHGREGRVEIDTVAFGAFRPNAFRIAGFFDETLERNQDDEFNLRLRRAGGQVVLDPKIRVFYRPRGSFRGLFRQYYEYGRWKAPVMRRHGRPTSARSLVPAAFVATLAALGPLSLWDRRATVVLAFVAGAYAALAFVFGVRCIRTRGEPWALLPRVLAVFVTVHTAHGIGMLAGWILPARKPVQALLNRARPPKMLGEERR
jgi:succinoglycan biosynthesis protein ExoA